MKHLVNLLFFTLGLNVLQAQSVQEAGTMMYYERYKTASDILRNSIKIDPRNTEAWYLLTRCYLKDDQLNSFWDTLPPVPADLANDPFLACAKGHVLLHRGNRDSAAYFFKMALDQSSQKDPRILLAVAIAHVQSDSGDAAYALQLLSKAIKLDKKNPALYVEQGNAYRRLRNGTEAYKSYTKASDINRNYAEAPFRLGKLFATQNNPEMYLKYYQQAVAMDSAYAPAWYALYYYYYFKDPAEAMTCLQKYISVSDTDPANIYRRADLFYLTKNYSEAIRSASVLLSGQADPDPRIFKLIAYSYNELNDSVKAREIMHQYFQKQKDSLVTAKDYESMAKMYGRFAGMEDSAAMFLSKAADLEKDTTVRVNYYKDIAEIYKKVKDYEKQGFWLGKYYQANDKAGNVDLFNWGIAAYLAKNYVSSDSIFTMYAEKYPDQTFGYYWKARSEIAIDTAMQEGLAVPSYKQVIKLSTEDSTGKANRKWMIEAYGYLAAYEANTEKNYPAALGDLENLLALDPGNESAKKYIEIIKKNSSRSAVSRGK